MINEIHNKRRDQGERERERERELERYRERGRGRELWADDGRWAAIEILCDLNSEAHRVN